MESATSGSQEKQKIAVIGAGMTGLCTLRHFANDPKYSIVAFERMATVGGVWNYPDQAETFIDEDNTSPYYCRTYRDLRINIPRDLNGFQDFPFPKGEDSYCKREVVLQYFHDYVKHFKLLPFVKINLIKPSVRIVAGQVTKWTVEVLNLENQVLITEEFDNVIICSGHNHLPHMPKLKGIENFRGPILHSSQYRVPEIFQQKTVLIVGGKLSANDLTCEMIPYAKQVIICRRSSPPLFNNSFSNVKETGEPAGFGANHAIFSDGSSVDIDVVLLCTGFVFDYPFLSDDCNVRTSRGRVSPVYRHMIHCENPSMAFIGLPTYTVIFHVANVQAAYYKAYLDGKVKLPSTMDMLANEELEFKEKMAGGVPEHMAHDLYLSQWPYMEQLAQEAGIPTYEPATKAIFEISVRRVRSIPHWFRNFQLEKIDSENYIDVPLPQDKQLFGLKPDEMLRGKTAVVNSEAVLSETTQLLQY